MNLSEGLTPVILKMSFDKNANRAFAMTRHSIYTKVLPFKFFMTRVTAVAASILVITVASGCGQKGDLYLPSGADKAVNGSMNQPATPVISDQQVEQIVKDPNDY